MASVYFGAEKGKIVRKRLPKTIKDIKGDNAPFPDGGEALVYFNGKDPLRWLPLSKLARRLERDVDGSIIQDRYLDPLFPEDLSTTSYQTIAFDDGSYGIYLGMHDNMLIIEGFEVFYRRIESAVGIIMEGDQIVNEKLLRKIERFS